MNYKIERAVKDFPYGAVKIKDAYKENAFKRELAYLRSLDCDRLMAGFYETAGLIPKKERYQGWEVTEIQGHTLGHYLTAVAQAYGYTKDKELLDRLIYMCTELKGCQRKDGFLFASPEEIFDRVEQKKPAWVPWYTMHKILSGLLSVYKHTKNEIAIEVAEKLGKWISHRCMGWSEEVRRQVLAVEYGGMNDCLYELYRVTQEEEFLKAAHQFDEITLFQKLYDGEDVLNGLHANTTIPKVLGALKRYCVIGKEEKFYLVAAENFWDMVVSHHSYVTGGNSEWEHFGKPDVLDRERTSCTCETCNTYNMLKLSKMLFEITKDRKYADFYENTYLNAILSSQNPETGMTTYFQPMASGYFKVYSTPYNSFWCCTGSGMENFTKLTEGAVYKSQDTMYLIRCEDSEIYWEEKGLKLELTCRQEEDTYEVKVQVLEKKKTEETSKVCLLIPKWNKKAPVILENGISAVAEKDWILFEHGLEEGHGIVVKFTMGLECKALPDNPHACAFLYGPYVLSSDMGKEEMETTYTGVDVLVPQKEMILPDYIVLNEEKLEEFYQYPDRFLKKTPGKIQFTLENQNRELIFIPHYLRYQERYGIYWLVYPEGSEELNTIKEREERRYRLKQEQLDVIPVGNDQYELAHHIRGEFTDSDMEDGHPARYCSEKGWFSYEMQGDKNGAVLCMTVSKRDKGSRFMILTSGAFQQEVQIPERQEEFFVLEILLDSACFDEEGKVKVRFEHKQGRCRIFDELYLKKKDHK